jgi:hypothetical protein
MKKSHQPATIPYVLNLHTVAGDRYQRCRTLQTAAGDNTTGAELCTQQQEIIQQVQNSAHSSRR